MKIDYESRYPYLKWIDDLELMKVMAAGYKSGRQSDAEFADACKNELEKRDIKKANMPIA